MRWFGADLALPCRYVQQVNAGGRLIAAPQTLDQGIAFAVGVDGRHIHPSRCVRRGRGVQQRRIDWHNVPAGGVADQHAHADHLLCASGRLRFREGEGRMRTLSKRTSKLATVLARS